MDWWTSIFPDGLQYVKIEAASGQPVAIAYGEVGSGPPLLLVHGLGVWSHCWREVIPALAQQYRVICFDSLGSGYSDAPQYSAQCPAQTGHQVVELARIIEALCDRPAILVGESLGGLASLGVTIDYPHLVERLVVINAAVFPQKLPSATMRFLAAVPQPLVEAADRYRLMKRLQPLAKRVVRLSNRQVIAPQTVKPRTVNASAHPYLERRGPLSCFARDLKLALSDIEQYLQGEDCFTTRLHQRLGAIAQPTLVLWGEADSWFPVA
ncbi:MAG: alpha/beta hydrolase, partial [Cyanobacteria bacterium P01_A01_bin.135]